MGQELVQGVCYLKKCVVVLQTVTYLPPLLPLCERLIGQGIDCQVMLSEEMLPKQALSSEDALDSEIPHTQLKADSEVMSRKSPLSGESVKEDIDQVERPWQRGVESSQGILYLTDDPQVYAALSADVRPITVERVLVGEDFGSTELTEANHPPVLIYLHPGNQDVDFGDARYALEDPQEVEPEYLERVYRRCFNLPWEILVTERCWLRETVEEDVDSFWKMYQEPEITQYTEQLYPSPEAERGYIREYRRLVYSFYEFGVWTVLDRQSGAVVGRAGLSVREGYDLPELGFVIGKEWQGRGLAREVCRGILKYARQQLGFDRIQVLVHEENAVSLHLCRELGFREQAPSAQAERASLREQLSSAQTGLEGFREIAESAQTEQESFRERTELTQTEQESFQERTVSAQTGQENMPDESGISPHSLVEMEQNGQQVRLVYMVCEQDLSGKS